MKKIIISLSVALTTLLPLISNDSALEFYVKPLLYTAGVYATGKFAYAMGKHKINSSWHYARVGAVGLGAFATTKAVETLFNPQNPSINTLEAACAGFGAALFYHASIPFITKLNITRLYSHISRDKLETYVDSVDEASFDEVCTAISPLNRTETRFILLTRLSKIESLQDTIDRGSFYINNEFDSEKNKLEYQEKKIKKIIATFRSHFEGEKHRIPAQKTKNPMPFIQLIHGWIVALDKTLNK